ncbi:MAG: hypothetical protein AABY64_09185 [Bdellovibrionota bacterium]
MYESGVVVAFLVGAAKFIWLASYTNSNLVLNFSKIGQHYNPYTSSFESEPSNHSFFQLAAYLMLIAPIFSWLSVASAVGLYIFQKARAPTPHPQMQQIYAQLSHFSLPKETVEKIWSSRYAQTNSIEKNNEKAV